MLTSSQFWGLSSQPTTVGVWQSTRDSTFMQSDDVIYCAYLRREICTTLGIIPSDFSRIGSATQQPISVSSAAASPSDEECHCSCPNAQSRHNYQLLYLSQQLTPKLDTSRILIQHSHRFCFQRCIASILTWLHWIFMDGESIKSSKAWVTILRSFQNTTYQYSSYSLLCSYFVISLNLFRLSIK